MPEGLSASEVGKEIGEHSHDGQGERAGRHGRLLSISEALLLSVVAIVAAWSGYSAAKWSTDSSLKLAKASATRAQANRAFQESLTARVGDAVTFNAWFDAHIRGDMNGARVAEKRFRPQFRPAFKAWLATHPFTNAHAPPGPQTLPQYHATGDAQSKLLTTQAEAVYAEGQKAAETGDKYIRTTVILASVLFLVGISTQFPLRVVRYGLISVGAVLLLVAVVQILQLPGPPSG